MPQSTRVQREELLRRINLQLFEETLSPRPDLGKIEELVRQARVQREALASSRLPEGVTAQSPPVRTDPFAQAGATIIRSTPGSLDPFRFTPAPGVTSGGFRLPADRDFDRPPVPSAPQPTQLSASEIQLIQQQIRDLEDERASLTGLPPDPDELSLVTTERSARLQQLSAQIARLHAALEVPLRPFGIFGLPSEATQPPPQRARPNPSAGPPIFSGCDIIPVITVNGQIMVLGNILALSYSIHRDKTPVRVLGRTYAKSFCRGGRTIAGSLVSVVFDQAALSEVMDLYGFELASDDPMTTLVPDQMPPFDITITYWSETGDATGGFRGAYMKLFGVEIVDEGQSHSINDLYVENQMQFICQDIEHLVPVSETITGADGSLKRVSPFQRALFQAQVGEIGVSDLDESIRTLSATISNGSWKQDRLQEVLENLDQCGIPDPSGRTRDQLLDEYNKIGGEIATAERDVAAARTQKDANRATSRVRSITDPTRNFHDQPFDTVIPRRL